jgi:hypothetical protein
MGRKIILVIDFISLKLKKEKEFPKIQTVIIKKIILTS